ncbi:hypothetical protein GCM10010252_18080 [Streptomyces aureoverticillatus]|nr:hypothetical protein GCM10010252_18080 [Streptomyces aureoverticillatus]
MGLRAARDGLRLTGGGLRRAARIPVTARTTRPPTTHSNHHRSIPAAVRPRPRRIRAASAHPGFPQRGRGAT